MMTIKTGYFGEVEVNEDEIIRMEEGMLGFELLKNYVLLKDEEIFLEWMQSTEEEVSFAVVDPFLIKKSYEFEIPEAVLQKLEIEDAADVAVRTVVIIPEDLQKIRTNLQAPVIINMKGKKAMQILLDDAYPMRYEFYDKVGE
ncbi:MAG: flagellar assembly protein FliW [Peptostreptococcaceae bacterium]|nr:flagellar assembly protein FliW [Peptostreptococcaceae bacterium]